MAGRRMLAVVGLALALLLGLPAVAAADVPLTVGGGFQLFSFGGPGSRTDTYTFTTAVPVVVTVADISCMGDEFRLFDNGALVGTTSQVDTGTCPGLDEVSDPEVAVADPRYSSGSFRLGAGTHALVIEVVESPFAAGAAALRVDVAPPDTPRSKNDCRNGGWRNLVDAAGQPFRNQGQCVSTVVRGRSA